MGTKPFLVTLAVVAAACGGSGPSGPGGDVERYGGNHRFTFTIEGVPFEFVCTGSLVIIEVRGTTLTGTMTIDPSSAQCASLAGTTSISGTLASNGTITFATPDQDELADSFEVSTGCSVSRIDEAFTGSLQNRQVDVSFTLTGQCPEGQVDIVWRIVMVKAT
jgi:hypothetical protein